MAYTTDYNLSKLPSGAVDWIAAYNDLCDKIEAGRTLAKIAAATITQYQCFYIDSAGKAAISSASTDVVGIWKSSSTALDVLGFGQVGGTITNGGWSWTPGTFLYSGVSGALTVTVSTTGRRIAYALTATKILVLSNFMSVYTASKAMVSDSSGNVSTSSVTGTELGYLAGVTSAIQTQMDLKAPKASPAFTGDVSVEKTIVPPGTTGAQTINKTAGRVNFAISATSLVVTNSLVTANSIIVAVAVTADSTGYVRSCVPTSGSFTINVIAPTAEMAVSWIVIN